MTLVVSLDLKNSKIGRKLPWPIWNIIDLIQALSSEITLKLFPFSNQMWKLVSTRHNFVLIFLGLKDSNKNPNPTNVYCFFPSWTLIWKQWNYFICLLTNDLFELNRGKCRCNTCNTGIENQLCIENVQKRHNGVKPSMNSFFLWNILHQ